MLSQPRRAVVAVAVLGILALTLTPLGNKPSEPFSTCLVCGPRGVADGILNLLLFVPLGFLLGWYSKVSRAAPVFGLLLSVAIELLQTIIPGRDPSLSDIIFNTLGTAVGAVIGRHLSAWLRPSFRNSLVLSASSIVAAALVMAATAVLLSPIESFYSIASDDDRVIRFTAPASELGLDQPEFWLSGPLGTRSLREADTVKVRQIRSHWTVSVGRNSPVAFGPTVGQGWTLLAYPDAIARRWSPALNALWMLILTVPIGFWSRRYMLAVAAAALALLLVLIPAVTGVAATSSGEWAGAAVGLLAGAMLGALLDGRARRAAVSAGSG